MVLVSRTCDLVRRPALAVADAVHLPDDPEAEIGRKPHLAPVPAFRDGDWYADLSTLRHAQRDEVCALVEHLEPGLETGTHASAFRRHVGRYTSKPSWDDYIETTVEPLTTLAKKRHNKNSEEGALYRALSDIRLELETPDDPGPRDHHSPRGLEIHYIVRPEHAAGLDPDAPATLMPADVAWLINQPSLSDIAKRWAEERDELRRVVWLEAYCAELTRRCVDRKVFPVTEVTHNVVAEDQFTFQQVKRSAPIEVEHLSYPEAPEPLVGVRLQDSEAPERPPMGPADPSGFANPR